MDVFSRSPSSSFRSSSFSSSSPSSSARRGSQSRSNRGTASKIIERVICATLTCVFAAVGSLVGAITGALIGLATESGLLRGAGIGAISGAVFAIEAVESSLDLWNSRESGIWSLLYVIDILCSLLSGRIVREKVDPAMQSAVQSQMSAADLPSIENFDLFATDSTGGLAMDTVENLPKTNITAENLEAAGESLCCSVCLQDLQVGETVRRLPHCHHMFHLPCIDAWLIRHGSCPLCRRDI
ncbi:NEP1-interacting protein 2-like [Musa acuminata AAA Group]|uniref:NEP1-interacting protein 2-like n=1 Tax=Musa acuminata AAA Group TaxID=214697 RepID=UPI0031DCB213